MKQHIINHWYRSITAISMLIVACGLFIFSLKYNTAKAGNTGIKTNIKQYENTWFVTSGKTIYKIYVDADGILRCKAVFNENGKAL